MRAVKAIGVAAIAVLVLYQTSSAGTEGGKMELGVGAMVQAKDDGNSTDTTLSLQLQGSYYIASWFSMGLAVQGTLSSPENGDDSSAVFFLVRPDFYLAPRSPVVPFVGPHFGAVSSERGGESESTFTYGMHGGLKIFVGESTSLNLEINGSVWEPDNEWMDEVTVVQGIFGMSYYF